jgi:glycerol kinase
VPSAEGVVFVPALQGLGSPYGEEQVRGLFWGLTRGSSGAHLSRAVLEGVAHRVVDILHTFPLAEQELRVDGGLAQSALLLQMIADLGDCTLLRSAETEATALGAAQLAGLAVGTFATPAACRETLAAPHTTRPALDAAERERARARWQRALGAAQ